MYLLRRLGFVLNGVLALLFSLALFWGQRIKRSSSLRKALKAAAASTTA
jgi:hypothetical protein